MKKSLKTIISIMLLVAMIAVPISTMAETVSENFDVSLEASKSILNPGDEFEIKVKVANLRNMTEVLVAGGQIKYSKNLVDLVEITNADNDNKEGNNIYFNETEDALNFVSDKRMRENETLINMKFRVKANVELPAQFSFTIENIEGSSANGDIYPENKTMTLNIEEKREEETFTSQEYIVGAEIITKVAPDTTVSAFKSNIETNQNMVIKSGDRVVGDTELVATGMTVTAGSKTYTIIVRGDIDGNGTLTTNDIALFKLHYTKTQILTGNAFRAADVDLNAETTTNDLSLMKKYYVKLTTLAD